MIFCVFFAIFVHFCGFLCDTDCTSGSIAHVSSFQSRLRSLYDLCFSQSGGIYNSYSTVARDLWRRKPRPCPRATPSDSGRFTAINPWPRHRL